MTTTPASLSRPAAAMAEHARHTAHLRSHRAQIDEWLRALNLTSVEQLFDAIGGPDAHATATLLVAHQRGVTLATTVLAGAKARILSAIARHAPGDTVEERLQVTLEAFLTRALPRVKPGHTYVDQQLYFVTLRTVTKQHDRRPADFVLSFDVAGADVSADIDGYLTGGVLLQWGVDKGYLSESDRQALAVRYGGSKALPVREVAAALGVRENKLESQLRRAVKRLREGVAAQRDELDRACVAARWSVEPAADNTSVSAQVGVAA
jgi:hypothetical protein